MTEETYNANLEAYRREAAMSNQVLKVDRHNAATGEWYGPSPEPCPASPNCICSGCDIRYGER